MLELGHSEKVECEGGQAEGLRKSVGPALGVRGLDQGTRAGSRAGTGCLGEEDQELEGFY